MMRNLILLLSCLGLMGCGGGHNPDKEVAKSGAFKEIQTGKFLSLQTLPEIAGGANFELTMSLSDGGTVTLHTYANNSLNSGVEFEFERHGNTLHVHVRAQGQEQEWSSYFSSLDASEEIQLNLDVHNNETPSHVLVWSGAKRDGLDHTNTLYNSGEDSVDLGYAGSPGNGTDRAWGYSVVNATVTSATTSEPQDEH